MAEQATLERWALPDAAEVDWIAAAFRERPPQELLRWAGERFGSRLALVTSFQATGMVILDLVARFDLGIRVVTVDSGRLPAETYDLIDHVRDRYQLPIEVLAPDAAALESFVGAHGVNSFYRSPELRLRCCEIRKVAPLNRALGGLDAWISGRRRDQSAARRHLRPVEIDQRHGGRTKLNPLADWTESEVWDYLRVHHVPYNALYDQGYTSIGCAPCTRPVQPGADARSGRWWWEESAPKECGLHCHVRLAPIHALPSAPSPRSRSR